mmetsp:Transcript_151181/g.275035  ORF Transcript_151181/g.275035 Transcript_151181/m.275035 type:complete len:224 (+) Transcript_151181:1839-2510(+)
MLDTAVARTEVSIAGARTLKDISQSKTCSIVYRTPLIGTEYTAASPAPVPQATSTRRCSCETLKASASTPPHIAAISRGAASRPKEPPSATQVSWMNALNSVTPTGILFPVAMLVSTWTKAVSRLRSQYHATLPKRPPTVTESMRRQAGAAAAISRNAPLWRPKPIFCMVDIKSATRMPINPVPTPCSNVARGNCQHPRMLMIIHVCLSKQATLNQMTKIEPK